MRRFVSSTLKFNFKNLNYFHIVSVFFFFLILIEGENTGNSNIMLRSLRIKNKGGYTAVATLSYTTANGRVSNSRNLLAGQT